jgi:hypothetical protein
VWLPFAWKIKFRDNISGMSEEEQGAFLANAEESAFGVLKTSEQAAEACYMTLEQAAEVSYVAADGATHDATIVTPKTSLSSETRTSCLLTLSVATTAENTTADGPIHQMVEGHLFQSCDTRRLLVGNLKRKISDQFTCRHVRC